VVIGAGNDDVTTGDWIRAPFILSRREQIASNGSCQDAGGQQGQGMWKREARHSRAS
jgi:hypothetical protein